mmetsp:Transcript_102400/g.330296  ORF Transcript_102400/g.330296 Transcript_102400/m.330296 type:complete len:258 (-) Transcript_102400:356-1129(-)
MVTKLGTTPRVNLAIQRSHSALLQPPPQVLRVCQLRAVEQVVPLQPFQRAYPTHFSDGKVHEDPPPPAHAPGPLNAGSRVVQRGESSGAAAPGLPDGRGPLRHLRGYAAGPRPSASPEALNPDCGSCPHCGWLRPMAAVAHGFRNCQTCAGSSLRLRTGYGQSRWPPLLLLATRFCLGAADGNDWVLLRLMPPSCPLRLLAAGGALRRAESQCPRGQDLGARRRCWRRQGRRLQPHDLLLDATDVLEQGVTGLYNLG